MRIRMTARGWRGLVSHTRLAVVVGGIALFSLAGTVLADEGVFSGSGDNVWPYASTGRAPVLAAVGDISCQPQADENASQVCNSSQWPAQTATANQVENMKPDLVAVLGDLQYQVGRYEDFTGSFDHTWGAFKFLQRPTPGNHEFYNEHKETGVNGYGYFDYFNGYQVNGADGTAVTHTFTQQYQSGSFTQPIPRPDGQAGHFQEAAGSGVGVGDGWYSYNLGSWHIISLNAECAVQPGGCDPACAGNLANCNPQGSWFLQETDWLRHDLATDHAACTLAYWHQPTFSAASPSSSAPGGDPEGPTADVWWRLLYAHRADLILNGHDHLYARFAPMDPNGNADPTNGIREFIIGTGGESLDTLDPSTPNLQAGTGDYYGVMKLKLRPSGYAWDFESAPNAPNPGAGTYSDTGSASCHRAGDD